MKARTERVVRALLARCGLQVSSGRLGRCGECDTWVYDDEKRTQVHGVWFHEDCARYRRSAAA